jgi:hypothetical protein
MLPSALEKVSIYLIKIISEMIHYLVKFSWLSLFVHAVILYS